MRLKINIMNLNEPNKNNTIYSKNCMKDIYNLYEGQKIPLTIIPSINENNFAIGDCKLTSLNYPQLEIDANIYTDFIKDLLDKNLGGFGMNVVADVSDERGVKIVTHIAKINSIGYTINPSQSCSYEIIK